MKTFFSLTFQELSAYNPFGYKFHPKPEQIEILETEAKNVAKEIANGLRKNFNAKKVVLFGSLATMEFIEGSDIDIAVRGIPYDDFFKAVTFASGFSKKFKVDLVDAKDASDSLLDSIKRDGIEI
ncbi:MAG: nucleotidyltransferase domain-containing protein [Candidatus Acididesulfobacter guangdongensis]|uniref:Nucleotidyltransferase domain-containing protein n=1 Tax=Acididesulfobacter guangdongensis TaxID=2597225 RepID=A0A519BIM4_ACIG2|nr:MAG: nucleotidyltransferase domain-containing protein [Candidatus Acididesulfobacter guangdongensis]